MFYTSKVACQSRCWRECSRWLRFILFCVLKNKCTLHLRVVFENYQAASIITWSWVLICTPNSDFFFIIFKRTLHIWYDGRALRCSIFFSSVSEHVLDIYAIKMMQHYHCVWHAITPLWTFCKSDKTTHTVCVYTFCIFKGIIISSNLDFCIKMLHSSPTGTTQSSTTCCMILWNVHLNALFALKIHHSCNTHPNKETNRTADGVTYGVGNCLQPSGVFFLSDINQICKPVYTEIYELPAVWNVFPTSCCVCRSSVYIFLMI